MELSRADASLIEPKAKASALRHFGLDQDAWLAKGTEAEVYRLGESRVLKLYADPSRAAKLEVLRAFYGSLDANAIGFALPQIYEIDEIHGVLAVQERSIEGAPLADALPTLDAAATSEVREAYLDAVLKLSDVRTSYGHSRYLLFDDTAKSDSNRRGWNEFIYELAKLKLDRRRAALALDVTDLAAKEQWLRQACLAQRFAGPRTVVHGDFFPGNVLVDGSLAVTGVIDFGSFTMFGDGLYDVALACMFYDMYGPNRASVRDELVELALRKLGSNVEGTLYRYAMAYALMSCDLYASPDNLREDDHYKWAVDVLNTDRYWQRLR